MLFKCYLIHVEALLQFASASRLIWGSFFFFNHLEVLTLNFYFLSAAALHGVSWYFPFIFKMFWKFSRLATAEVCMEEREELTDLPCIFAVFFFFFFNRVKYTFFKNLSIWGEGCSWFSDGVFHYFCRTLFNFSLLTFPLPLSHSKRH